MQYLILERNDRRELYAEVNEKLQDGWELYGNLSVVLSLGQGRTYTQVVVKNK